MRRGIFLIASLILLALIIVQGASARTYSSVTANNASQSIWNETFAGSQNKTFWLTIPKYSIVVDAYMNFSGYNSSGNRTITTSVFTTVGNSSWQKINVSASSVKTMNNISMKVGCGLPGCARNVTVVIQDTEGTTNLSAAHSNVVIYGDQNAWTSFGDYNFDFEDSTDYRIAIYANITDNTLEMGFNASNPLGTNSSIQTLYPAWGIAMIIVGQTYPNNTYLDISGNSTHQWSYSGVFNQLNNKTSNFSASLNSYLSSCAVGSGDNCTIPLNLSSSTSGMMQVSGINVTYFEAVPPVLSAVNYLPSCVENGGAITWVWNQSDNVALAQSYCNFTAASTVQVQSTTLENNSVASCTYIVSQGGYSLTIYLEDTNGNTKSASYNFEVKAAGQCGSDPLPLGGGGGGGATTIEIPVYVGQCESGYSYNTSTGECELMLVETPVFSIEDWLTRPATILHISGREVSVNPFMIIMLAGVALFINSIVSGRERSRKMMHESPRRRTKYD